MGRLDRWARLTLWGHGSYAVCGAVGAVLGAVLAAVLGLRAGVDPVELAIAIATPSLGFLAAVAIMRIGFGYRRLVYYELSAASGALLALVVLIGGTEIEAAEALVVGAGVFMVGGRLGCFRVGCCHGRPARVGVAYTRAHARAGFPDHYVGVRLAPLQLVGAAADLTLVALAAIVFLLPHRPGEVIALYFSLYGLGRFASEFFRGDSGRPYGRGLSEAQWIAWVSLAAIALWSATDPSWATAVYAASAAIVTGTGAAIVATWPRRRLSPGALRMPARIAEVAALLRQLRVADATVAGAPVAIAQGDVLRLSFSRDGTLERYGVSATRGELGVPGARAVARTLAGLRGADVIDVLPGVRPGLVHIALATSDDTSEESLTGA